MEVCITSGRQLDENSWTLTGKQLTVNTYLAYPPDNKTDNAILYLTDIYGIPLVNNRL
jgi:hypothetical protein